MYKNEYSDIQYLKKIPKKPDFNALLEVIAKKPSSKPRLFEFFLNDELYNAFSDPQDYQDIGDWYLRHYLRSLSAYKNAGYDYVVVGGAGFGYPRKASPHSDRSYSLNEVVTIANREDFENYNFMNPENESYYKIYDDIKPYLPDGMKVIGQQPGGLLENVMALCGYDDLCYNLYDDTKLVFDIFDTIGKSLITYTKHIAEKESVGAMILNDDWGFNTQTMLGHADMRKYVLPYFKEMIKVCHDNNKPAILHSCGNLAELYEDLIDIGLDAKHSFEDVICPIETMYDKYRSRLALMGGIDVNYICVNSCEDVYKRTLAMIDKTVSGGGWAVGTGNSVPYYVPSGAYCSMIAAALTY